MKDSWHHDAGVNSSVFYLHCGLESGSQERNEIEEHRRHRKEKGRQIRKYKGDRAVDKAIELEKGMGNMKLEKN